MKFALSILLMTFAAAGAYAQVPQVDKIEVTEYGIFTTHPGSEMPTPSTASGNVHKPSNVTLVETTRTIHPSIGTHFGFRYSVVGQPSGTVVPFTLTIIYPAPGLKNPAAQQAKQKDEIETHKIIGEDGYSGYSFDHDWELVPGIWTFQLWYQGDKLAEQSFTVVAQ